MVVSHDRPATRLATRLAFLVAGFGIACWAPLVPFAEQRLAVDDATLGLLLLCIGIGSVVAMQFTGALSARHGAKPAIVASGLGLTAALPFLSVVTTPPALAIALLGFGAALGSLDVAMNIHAVEVERAAGRPLMSGFHALFSIGGFAGSAFMTFLLSSHLTPLSSTLCCAAIMLGAILVAWPRLLIGTQGETARVFVMPQGIVLLISGLAAAAFLVEGALLDWSALLVVSADLTSAARGGVGYMLFAIAMTAGRLAGDRVAARIGDSATLFWSGILAVAGFVVLLAASTAVPAMSGFVLIGLGSANIVPVLFRKAGSQTVMPPALAISGMTTAGYAGILAGPAAMGFVSKAVGLHNAFWMLAALLCLVPATARFVAGGSADGR
ncbi:MAG TPA: MFS transporter [Rhodopila sp.]|uniref:MFS transporter n=1 Tax=Rhodopila sp. TaxID=2480087 RepID=UPI002C502AFA|nr:MFS transporter [Rhodopila sp.]HVY15678.1 MFS transporter [Rhodopila sp.]